MTALEKIVVAEDKVAGLQDQLATVGTVLETAEHVAAEGQKVGRCFRRLFKVLLLISIVAMVVMVVMVVKKLVVRKSLEDEIEVHDASDEPAVVEEAADEEDPNDEAVNEDAAGEDDGEDS
jgi:flagellar biosynthesis/type III secretory pathway M-ring protein FliF/YscJ